jgi:hypothetical protein
MSAPFAHVRHVTKRKRCLDVPRFRLDVRSLLWQLDPRTEVYTAVLEPTAFAAASCSIELPCMNRR